MSKHEGWAVFFRWPELNTVSQPIFKATYPEAVAVAMRRAWRARPGVTWYVREEATGEEVAFLGRGNTCPPPEYPPYCVQEEGNV